MRFELNYEVDLSQPILTQVLKQPLFYSDSTAHDLVITLKDELFPELASGYAYFVHLNTNVTERQELEFSDDRSTCYVTLPAVVYNTLGPISIVVQLVDGVDKTTILALAGEVKSSKSSTVIDCSGIELPDIDDILDRLEQAEEEVSDITAAVISGIQQDNQADFLYKEFFGDDGNFNITQTSSRGYDANVTKVGRCFTYTRCPSSSGNWNGSSYLWINLTGTEHRSFGGNDTNALTNIKAHDSDFIDIPKFVRFIMDGDSSSIAHTLFGIKMVGKLDFLSLSTANNRIQLRTVFRRYDESTENYVYSSLYAPATMFSEDYVNNYGSVDISKLALVAFSPEFNDTVAGRLAYGSYDQFAMYLQRRSQSLAGSVILEPIIIKTFDIPLS